MNKFTDTAKWRENNAHLSGDKFYDRQEADDKDELVLVEAMRILRKREKDVSDLLVHCLTQQHRTHQQLIINNIYDTLKKYGNGSSDQRNEASVNWAKKATDKEEYFPYI
jgi:hypothetical protein